MGMRPDESARTVVTTRVLDAPPHDVFQAYADPDKLVRWWGPAGFTMQVETLDLREGGEWRFVFTGPDGKTYRNHLRFLEVRPRRFVVEHLSHPKYIGTVTFDPVEAGTRVTMHWTFETQKVFDAVRQAVLQGNEQNLDRLDAVVRGGSTP